MLEFFEANVRAVTAEEKNLFLNYSIIENAKIDGGKEFGIPDDIFQVKLKEFFTQQLYPPPDVEITLHWYGTYEGLSPKVYSFCYLHKLNDKLYKITSVTSLDQGKGYGTALLQHILLTFEKRNVFLFAFVPKQFKAINFYRSLKNVSGTTNEEFPFPEHPAEWLGEYKNKIEIEKWRCFWYPSLPTEKLRYLLINKFLDEDEFKSMVERNIQYFSKTKDEALMVGDKGNIIALWPVGTTIRYGVDVNSFPDKNILKKAVVGLNSAANRWNKINFGVKFEFTASKFRLNFYMKYRLAPKGDYALAFTPTRDISILYIHSSLFTDDELYVENILQHELGHILGLRHEHALDPQMFEGDAVLVGDVNPDSVMSYTFPPKIQKTDKEGIKKLYQHKEGDMIDGYVVTFV